MARLKMLRGPEPGKEYPLEQDIILIGRGRKNDIIIQDNEVSRAHCRLVRVLDDYEIHDLNSTNGTFVNGQEVTEGGWLLSAHVLVELGDSITFEYQSEEIVTGSSPPVTGLLEAQVDTYYLVIEQLSAEQPEIYLLDRMSISIGRDIDNDIVLQEAEVSRHHLRIVLTKEGYAIDDLNTMNGTFVNDRRLTKQRLLRSSDMVRIGTRVRMWYTDDPDRVVDNLRRGQDITVSADDETHEARPPGFDKPTDEVPQHQTEIRHRLAANALTDSVFLAYAPDDWEPVVGPLYAYLKKNHVPVWAAHELGPDSVAWEEAVLQAQMESPCLLAVISEAALGVPYVGRSVRHFVTRDKLVLLVQVGEIERLPMSIQQMPAVQLDPDDPMRAFRTILAEIRKLNLWQA